MRLGRAVCLFVFAIVALVGLSTVSQAQPINVITVDVTPFVTPGATAFGNSNTMGMALQSVDLGGDFLVTEVTPAVFSLMTAGQLAAFDLIAINNNPGRLLGGIGTTWQGVVGINSGGRVMLTSHDAPRFHLLPPPGSPPLGSGLEPFGAPALVRQAALWAGGVPGLTGLLVFNDAPGFVGGAGWNNLEMNLPAAWGITDLDPFGGNPIVDGGYTSIIPSAADPVYNGGIGLPLPSARFAADTVGSFSANIGDGSFHTVFGSHNANILSPSEVITNSGVIDVGGFGVGAFVAPAAGLDGTPITLVRNVVPEPSSIVLAGIGLAGLLAFGRRRRRPA